MKRKLVCLLIVSLIVLGSTPFVCGLSISPEQLIGSTWYGEFNSWYYNSTKPYRNATTLTFESCDTNGNFTAITSALNVDDTSQWCKSH